jgi:NTP pyrophosphatase (non-canonical NTP hydrolase)
MQQMSECGMIPHATKRIQEGEEGFTSEEDDYNTRPATGEECVELADWLNERAKEHNKKADAYNKEHGVG